MRNPVPSLCFLWFATLMSSAVYAQNAQISGIIKDQTGAILPGVTVTARNVETGLARTAVSQITIRVPSPLTRNQSSAPVGCGGAAGSTWRC